MKRHYLSGVILAISLCVLVLVVLVSAQHSIFEEVPQRGQGDHKMAGFGVGNLSKNQPVSTEPFLPFAPGGLRVVPGQARDVAFKQGWANTDGGYTLLEVTQSQCEWLLKKGMQLAHMGNVADLPHPGDLPVLCRGNEKDIFWFSNREQIGTSEISPSFFYIAVKTKLE